MNIKEQFSTLFEPALLTELQNKTQHLKAKEGDIIIDIGQTIRIIPIILSGTLKISRIDENRHELLLYYVNAKETCAMSFTCCMQQFPSEIKAQAEDDVEFERLNWSLLEAKRITKPDSFDFTIESVGVFSNISIVSKACDIMIHKCKLFISLVEKGEVPIELSENTTIANEYTITLKNEDYTLGNALGHFLYEKHYSGNKSLSFVGFRVPHPHIPNGVIRMAFTKEGDTTKVSQYLTMAAQDVITTFTNIQSKFKE